MMINGVFRIIEELIRIVDELKKLIAKTWLYVVLVERSISSRLRISNLPRKKFWNAVPRTHMAEELMA